MVKAQAMGIRKLPHLELCFRYDHDRSNRLGHHFVLWHQQSISIIGFLSAINLREHKCLSSIDCFPVTTPGLKLEMLRIKLLAASSDICMEGRSSLIWLLRPLSSIMSWTAGLAGGTCQSSQSSYFTLFIFISSSVQLTADQLVARHKLGT